MLVVLFDDILPCAVTFLTHGFPRTHGVGGIRNHYQHQPEGCLGVIQMFYVRPGAPKGTFVVSLLSCCLAWHPRIARTLRQR